MYLAQDLRVIVHGRKYVASSTLLKGTEVEPKRLGTRFEVLVKSGRKKGTLFYCNELPTANP